MKKIFISYRFTGEDLNKLQQTLSGICNSFTSINCETFCSINFEEKYKNENYSVKQILVHALENLEKSDYLFAFIDSDFHHNHFPIVQGFVICSNLFVMFNFISYHCRLGMIRFKMWGKKKIN